MNQRKKAEIQEEKRRYPERKEGTKKDRIASERIKKLADNSADGTCRIIM